MAEKPVSKYIGAAKITLAVLFSMTIGSAANAEWRFGIGTGFTRISAVGDLGLHTNAAGPVRFDVDLDTNDISDMTRSAFGLKGYAADGAWMIQYTLSVLDLKGDGTVTPADGNTLSMNMESDITNGELTVKYLLYEGRHVRLGLLTGARYSNHELQSVTSRVQPDGTMASSRDISEEWTDFLLGFTIGSRLGSTCNWSNRFDAGFGGSEGTFSFSTGITWVFFRQWSGTLWGSFITVDYDNGNRGDADWYAYDINETRVGIAVLYNW
jgi:hypothetical protein